tara:strand:- start:453 stop:785 length:333 start_codon:yes stop_codon:yes gene_type:complete
LFALLDGHEVVANSVRKEQGSARDSKALFSAVGAAEVWWLRVCRWANTALSLTTTVHHKLPTPMQELGFDVALLIDTHRPTPGQLTLNDKQDIDRQKLLKLISTLAAGMI